MSATWADIQRLAADLQRVQLTEGSKRLSEKNCVEIMSMLLATKEVDIVFTTDGREYVTKRHLMTEIKNECLANGGRISLSDLSHALNVDYEHIENGVKAILKQSDSFELYNAELISKEYVEKISNEVNEKLSAVGVLSAAQLAKTWDLPSDVLNNLVLNEVGGKINAFRDDDKIYTLDYLHNQKNLLRAVMNSLTRVTPIASIVSHINLSNTLFWRLCDELVLENEVPGTIVGGRSSYHAHYIPNEYVTVVKLFIRKAFEREHFLEVSTFKRLSITNPVGLLNEIFTPDEYSSLLFFSSVIISKQCWTEIYDQISEAMKNQHFADVSEYLPSSFSTDEDVEKVVSLCVKANKDWHAVPSSAMIYEKQLLVQALRVLDNFITEKAEKEAIAWDRKSKLITKAERQKMDDDWEAAKGRKGRGGRVKVTKQSLKEDPDSDVITANIDADEIESYLRDTGDFPEEALSEIAEQVLNTVRINLRNRINSVIQNARLTSAKEEKHSFVLLQENIQDIYNQICIFESGAATFSDSESVRLLSHLCKTLCTDIANMVLSYISGIERIKNFSLKVREECIESVGNSEIRTTILNLFAAVENNNIDAFHKYMTKLSSPALCSLNLRIPDKKQRMELIKSYAEGLRKRLDTCDDAASGLLLSLLLIFAEKAGVAVHATGKFVSAMIKEVAKFVDERLLDLLKTTEKLVISSFKGKGDEEMEKLLVEKLQEIKSNLIKSDHVLEGVESNN